MLIYHTAVSLLFGAFTYFDCRADRQSVGSSLLAAGGVAVAWPLLALKTIWERARG